MLGLDWTHIALLSCTAFALLDAWAPGEDHDIIRVNKKRELRKSPHNSSDLAKSSTERWSETPQGGEVESEETIPFLSSHLLL